MARGKVEIVGVDTSLITALSHKEQRQLFLAYQSGDDDAKEQLVNGNLKLVLSVLKSYTGRYENMDDLFQVGCIGLIKAIDNFDLSFDVKFSTYAVPMILGEVKRYIRDNNTIRISRSLKDIAYKAFHLKEEYYSIHGIEPSVSYLAEKLDVSEYDISNAFLAMKDPVSMYEPIYNDGGDTIYLYEQVEDKKSSIDFSNQLAIENAIDHLKQREKFILDERFIMGKSQMEISDELNISQAQVSRLEKKAIQQLKKVLK